MRVISRVKIAVLALVIALPSSYALAKGKTPPPPPGSCASGKSYIPTNTFCSYNCDDNTKWCSQRLCTNGVLTPVLPCWGTFCTAKCGG